MMYPKGAFKHFVLTIIIIGFVIGISFSAIWHFIGLAPALLLVIITYIIYKIKIKKHL